MIKITRNNIPADCNIRELDIIINIITKVKVAQVPKANQFCISTACHIQGEFNLVSEYDVPADFAQALEVV